MSFVGEPFGHDLFITYSHGRDDDGVGHLEGWTAEFVRELERELGFLPEHREISLFLDSDHRPGKGVDPTVNLPRQLREQIGTSAMLLVLMSPDYLDSQWCEDERRWWCERQNDLQLGFDGRIFVVTVAPTSKPWPSEFDGLPRSRFYGKVGNVDRPFGWFEYPPGPFSNQTRAKLTLIVSQLLPKLSSLRERFAAARRQQAEIEKLAGDSVVIYLHGRAEQARAWERAVDTLVDSGFSVVPERPDEVDSDPQRQLTIREARIERLASEADALLLVGGKDSGAMLDDLIVIGKQDRFSAKARSGRLLPCGLLDFAGPPITTERLKANARNLQTDWLDGTLEPWIPEVRRWLVRRSESMATPA